MRKKYTYIRVTPDIVSDFKNKQNVLNDMAKNLKINKKVYLIDTLNFFSKKKTFVYEDELAKFLKNKKKGLGGGVNFI